MKNSIIEKSKIPVTAGIMMTHNGRLLNDEKARLSAAMIRAYDTIHVQLTMPGGSVSDDELLKNAPELYKEKM